MHRRVRSETAARVVVVASGAETMQSLCAYLRAVGVPASGSHDIDELPRLVRPAVLAIVAFPDDFRWESVLAAIAGASTSRRELVSILVTAHPKRFEALLDGKSVTVDRHVERPGALGAGRVFLIPRPAWGWTILDVIRAHAVGEVGAGLDE